MLATKTYIPTEQGGFRPNRNSLGLVHTITHIEKGFQRHKTGTEYIILQLALMVRSILQTMETSTKFEQNGNMFLPPYKSIS